MTQQASQRQEGRAPGTVAGNQQIQAQDLLPLQGKSHGAGRGVEIRTDFQNLCLQVKLPASTEGSTTALVLYTLHLGTLVSLRERCSSAYKICIMKQCLLMVSDAQCNMDVAQYTLRNYQHAAKYQSFMLLQSTFDKWEAL